MSEIASPLPFTKILCAVDGSSFAERGGLRAAELARRYSSALIILHVAKYPANTLGVSSAHTVEVELSLTDPIVDREKKGAKDSMDRIATYAKKLGVHADLAILDTSSSIVDSIADYAYRNRIDLIIVGCLGTTAFRATLTGSVAEGMVREARCTVMVVR
jgi:nucleotide-binding universal stress UspA family protein